MKGSVKTGRRVRNDAQRRVPEAARIDEHATPAAGWTSINRANDTLGLPAYSLRDDLISSTISHHGSKRPISSLNGYSLCT